MAPSRSPYQPLSFCSASDKNAFVFELGPERALAAGPAGSPREGLQAPGAPLPLGWVHGWGERQRPPVRSGVRAPLTHLARCGSAARGAGAAGSEDAARPGAASARQQRPAGSLPQPRGTKRTVPLRPTPRPNSGAEPGEAAGPRSLQPLAAAGVRSGLGDPPPKMAARPRPPPRILPGRRGLPIPGTYPRSRAEQRRPGAAESGTAACCRPRSRRSPPGHGGGQSPSSGSAAPARRGGSGGAGAQRTAPPGGGSAGPAGLAGESRGSGCSLPNHRSAPGVGGRAAGAVLLGTGGVGLLQKRLFGKGREVLGTGPPALGGSQHLAGVKSPPPSPHRSPAPSHPRNSQPTSSHSALLQMTPRCLSVPSSSPSLSSLQH